MAYIQSISGTGVIDVYFFVPITGKKVTLVKVSLSSLLCQNLNNKKKHIKRFLLWQITMTVLMLVSG